MRQPSALIALKESTQVSRAPHRALTVLPGNITQTLAKAAVLTVLLGGTLQLLELPWSPTASSAVLGSTLQLLDLPWSPTASRAVLGSTWRLQAARRRLPAFFVRWADTLAHPVAMRRPTASHVLQASTERGAAPAANARETALQGGTRQ